MEISRRKLVTGLAAFIVAPAIIRVASLMPVKAWGETGTLELMVQSTIDHFVRRIVSKNFLLHSVPIADSGWEAIMPVQFQLMRSN